MGPDIVPELRPVASPGSTLISLKGRFVFKWDKAAFGIAAASFLVTAGAAFYLHDSKVNCDALVISVYYPLDYVDSWCFTDHVRANWLIIGLAVQSIAVPLPLVLYYVFPGATFQIWLARLKTIDEQLQQRAEEAKGTHADATTRPTVKSAHDRRREALAMMGVQDVPCDAFPCCRCLTCLICCGDPCPICCGGSENCDGHCVLCQDEMADQVCRQCCMAFGNGASEWCQCGWGFQYWLASFLSTLAVGSALFALVNWLDRDTLHLRDSHFSCGPVSRTDLSPQNSTIFQCEFQAQGVLEAIWYFDFIVLAAWLFVAAFKFLMCCRTSSKTMLLFNAFIEYYPDIDLDSQIQRQQTARREREEREAKQAQERKMRSQRTREPETQLTDVLPDETKNLRIELRESHPLSAAPDRKASGDERSLLLPPHPVVAAHSESKRESKSSGAEQRKVNAIDLLIISVHVQIASGPHDGLFAQGDQSVIDDRGRQFRQQALDEGQSLSSPYTSVVGRSEHAHGQGWKRYLCWPQLLVLETDSRIHV